MEGWRATLHSSINQKIIKSPHQTSVPTGPNFYFSHQSPPKVNWNGASKSKKKVINILNKKIGSIFKIIFKKYCLWHAFLQELTIHDHESMSQLEDLQSPPTKILKIQPNGVAVPLLTRPQWVPADGVKGGVSTRSFCQQQLLLFCKQYVYCSVVILSHQVTL